MGVSTDRGERRRYTGRLSAGTLSVGDEVVALPSGSRSTVTGLDTLDDDRTTAVAPLSISVQLADDIDIGRGDVLVSGVDGAHEPVLAREIDATVCWFGATPLRAGDRVSLKHTARTVRATVQALHSRLDPETLDEKDSPVELSLNDIGIVTLRTSSVIVADPYLGNRDAGAFILIDESSNDTVGAGTIAEAREVKPGEQTRNDIKWHPSALDRAHRWGATGRAEQPSGSPGCRPRVNRQWRWRSNARWSNRAVPHTFSMATTCATDCPTISASVQATELRTSVASGT